MLAALRSLMDERRNPKIEILRFNIAQDKLDFATMWDVLYHAACQYCKKHRYKTWNCDTISEIATDMAATIIRRYHKDPSYRCKHAAAIHFAFLGRVYGEQQKTDKLDKQCISYDDYYQKEECSGGLL